jgi:hypothetical protein
MQRLLLFVVLANCLGFIRPLSAETRQIVSLRDETIILETDEAWVSSADVIVVGRVKIVTHGHDLKWEIMGDLGIEESLRIVSFTDDDLAAVTAGIPAPPRSADAGGGSAAGKVIINVSGSASGELSILNRGLTANAGPKADIRPAGPFLPNSEPAELAAACGTPSGTGGQGGNDDDDIQVVINHPLPDLRLAIHVECSGV